MYQNVQQQNNCCFFAKHTVLRSKSKDWLASGADPGFQVRGRGAHLKKLRRAEGGTKIVGVFRVKNHDFTPKNHIFSNFKGGAHWVRPPPLDPPLGLETG